MRAYNNLLEYLHHSMFFYVLPNSDSFLSISLYSPIILLLVLPLIVTSLAQLARSRDAKVSFIPVGAADDEVYVSQQDSFSATDKPMLEATLVLGSVYLSSAVLWAFYSQSNAVRLFYTYSSQSVTHKRRWQDLCNAVNSIVLPILTFLISTWVRNYTPTRAPILKHIIQEDGTQGTMTLLSQQITTPLSDTFKAIFRFWTAVLLLALSVLNFSMAVVMALPIVPLLLAPNHKRSVRVLISTVFNPCVLSLALKVAGLNGVTQTLWAYVWGIYVPAVIGAGI